MHTQQVQDLESNLLSISLLEGIAEFVSMLATGTTQSHLPALQYGLQHDAQLREVFKKDMFSYEYGCWLWSDAKNEFGTRDLAYYMGYAIAKKYYEQTSDKQAAIKEMIELDHYKEEEIEAFVNHSGYFKESMEVWKKEYRNIENEALIR